MCMEQDCLDKKFVVFASHMDLKAHQLESHPNGLTKDARRDARTVDISSFDYRTPYVEPRGGRRGGRGRGRDPNAEPLPASSAQPLRRDEIAYQRSMAISTSQPSAMRQANTSPAPRRQEIAMPSTEVSNPIPQVEHLNVDSTDLTPQEQARRIQHNAVVDHAAQILKNDSSRLNTFRSCVSAYRSSSITATELIDSFFALFDCSSKELGTLIRELADIYENEIKRADLLKAWNDWRAINEDYPSLPGPSGHLAATAAPATTSGGRRILKLKSSTARSSRSATNQQVAWAGAGGKPTSSSTSTPPFPPLAASNRVGARVGTVPWGSSATSSPSLQPKPAPRSVAASPAPIRGADAFPALPATVKPSTHMLGLHHGAVRWDSHSSSPSNPWGGANSSGNSANPSAVTSGDEGEAGLDGGGKAGKKGKKGKQTIMMKWG